MNKRDCHFLHVFEKCIICYRHIFLYFFYSLLQVDEFQVKSLELGEIHGVTIGHSEKGRGQGWFCERVVVKSKLSPLMKVFPCNRYVKASILQFMVRYFCLEHFIFRNKWKI